MADGRTYGVNFPFRDSPKSYYFDLTENAGDEIRANLLHLILTARGSRYYNPDFGTRIYEFIFDPLDGETFDGIKSEIQQQVDKYIPNLTINEIKVVPYLQSDEAPGDINQELLGTSDIYRIPGRATQEYTAKLTIDYTDDNNSFGSREFIIINI
jgi:phage baseplate assembly protein W